MRGKRPKLGEPCPKVRLSQDRLAIVSLSLGLSPLPQLSWVRGERPKLGEPCPKVRLSQDRVRLSQDRMAIVSPSLGLFPSPNLAGGGGKDLSSVKTIGILS